MATQTKTLLLHPDDNVLIALSDLKKDEVIMHAGEQIRVLESVPAKHKMSLINAAKGDVFKMYGVMVGKATEPVSKGALLTTQNLKHDTVPYTVRKSTYQWGKPDISKWKNATFNGYHRSDGQVGTRNFWLVVPLVFCENRNIEFIKNAFVKKLGYATPDKYETLVEELIHAHGKSAEVHHTKQAPSKLSKRVFENIDGIKFLTHSGGCGGTREDSDNLCNLIAGYIHNPNVAGATILSLGCQHAQIDTLKASLNQKNPNFDKPVLFYEQQKFTTEELLLTTAITETFTELVAVNKITRQPAPLSQLTIGLKCGGSDGFSGLTANPAMGYVSDLLVALGGKTILAEFPELCGVEQELIDRSVSIDIAEKFSRLMTEYNTRAELIGSGFSMNPSPGNIKDGLLTDAMKSAGAAKKGGTAPVSDVLDYAEYVKKPGLNLLCTPGNDVEATTGMGGSGATLIIFSTGLGTPTGNAVSPVIKTATNSTLAKKLSYLIDFDHGDIIEKRKSIHESAEELLEFIIRVANGETLTKAEQLQQDDFIPWKKGVSL
jgi:altronate hydrolase